MPETLGSRARATLAALAAAGLAACAARPPVPGDVLRGLAHEGYTPNPGLSASFEPGNVVQVAEGGPEGTARALSPPLVAAWRSDCFPADEPRESPFALAETSARSTRAFALEGPAILKLLPSLGIDASSATSQRLTFENPRVRSFAKTDLSERLSRRCVERLARAMRAGDRPEWFAVVLEAITVDRLRLEIAWAAGVDARVRESVTASAGRVLEAVAGAGAGRGGGASISTSDETHSVVEVSGAAIVAYRARPLQAEHGDVAAAAAGKPSAADLRETFLGAAPEPHGGAVARIAVRLLGPDGPRRVRLDRPFRSGEAFQLEVTSSRSGYLFLLHAMPGEQPAVLWPRLAPRSDEPLDANAIRAHEPTAVPPSPASLRFDDRAGNELFYVVVRPDRSPPRLGVAAAPVAARPFPGGENAVVQFSVRSGGGEPLRGVVFDPGAQDADPSFYFASAPSAASEDALLEFQLAHER
ncbi:MAG TPA: DUF4384 domain-containing protein [Anaeromyxobacter sp.]|nr:DUF4384 domain-containing protein [Anaeromyxobacter sp.]